MTSVGRQGRQLPKSGQARDVAELHGAGTAGRDGGHGGGAYPGRRRRHGPRGHGGGRLGIVVVAGRIAVAVVAGEAGPGRRPVDSVAVAVGGGVDNASAVARAEVIASGAAPGNVAASAAVGAASIAIPTASAVTNAPAEPRTDAAAGTRDAASSSWAAATSGNAATGSVATERRCGDGGVLGGQPAVVVPTNGVDTPAEASGVRSGVRAGGQRRGSAPTTRRAAGPVAGRCRWSGPVDGVGHRVASERGDHAGETPEVVPGAGGGAPLRGAPQVVPRGVHRAGRRRDPGAPVGGGREGPADAEGVLEVLGPPAANATALAAVALTHTVTGRAPLPRVPSPLPPLTAWPIDARGVLGVLRPPADDATAL